MATADVARAGEAATERGRRVGRAIAAAGGPERLIGALREAAMARGAHWPADPEGEELEAAGVILADLDARLGRLEPGGPLAAALGAERAGALAELAAARSGAEVRLVAGYARIVAGAAAGDEPSRAMIEVLAVAEPRAFAPGFAAALAAARAGPGGSAEADAG